MSLSRSTPGSTRSRRAHRLLLECWLLSSRHSPWVWIKEARGLRQRAAVRLRQRRSSGATSASWRALAALLGIRSRILVHREIRVAMIHVVELRTRCLQAGPRVFPCVEHTVAFCVAAMGADSRSWSRGCSLRDYIPSTFRGYEDRSKYEAARQLNRPSFVLTHVGPAGCDPK